MRSARGTATTIDATTPRLHDATTRSEALPERSATTAGMDDEPMKPGVEAGRVTQRRKVAPGADQGLLGRVLGAVMIPQDPIREGVAPVDARRGEGRECARSPRCARSTSSTCTLPALDGCGPSGRFTEYGTGCRRNVQIQVDVAATRARATAGGRPPRPRRVSSQAAATGACRPGIITP